MTARPQPQPHPLLDTILAYAAYGRRVLPLWPAIDGQCGCGKAHEDDPRDIGKHPIGQLVPNGLDDATTDQTTIERMFNGTPKASWGWRPRDDEYVIDVDDEATAFGHLQISAPPKTEIILTGRGYHAVTKLSNGSSPPPQPPVDHGYDIKTSSGYLVGSGSLHANGFAYTALSEPGTASEAEPDLDRALRAVRAAPAPVVVITAGTSNLLFNGDERAPGDRHPDLVKVARLLGGRDIRGDQMRDLLMGWNQTFNSPPKTDTEIARIVGWASDPNKVASDPDMVNNTFNNDDFVAQMARNTWSLEELLVLKVEHVPMIIDGLTPRRGLGMILGNYKAGKTGLVLQLAESIAMLNGEVFGIPVNEPLNVWANEAEGSRASLQARVTDVHHALGSPTRDRITDRLRVTFRQINLGGDLKGGLDRVRRMYDHFGVVPDVLFVGVLMKIADIKDENASSQMQPVMNALDAFAAEYDNLVVFSHHTAKVIRDEKGERLGVGEFFSKSRGSGVTLGSVDFAIAIDRLIGEPDARINIMLRDGATSSFDVDFRYPLFVPPAGRLIVLQAPSDDESKAIIESLAVVGGQSITDLAGNVSEALGRTVSDKTIERRVDRLIGYGTVGERTSGGRRKRLFSLTSSPSSGVPTISSKQADEIISDDLVKPPDEIADEMPLEPPIEHE